MDSPKKKKIIILSIATVVIGLIVFILESCGVVDSLKEKLLFTYDTNGQNKVIFVDVQDGNCAIIQSGDKTAIINFGGVKDGGNSLIKAIRKYRITKIDYAFITITDEYHLGGFMALCDMVTIDKVITPNFDDYVLNNSPTALIVKDKLNSLNCEIVELNKTYVLGNFSLKPIYYYHKALSSSGRAVLYQITDGKHSLVLGGNFSDDIIFEQYKKNKLFKTDILLLPGFSDSFGWNYNYFKDVGAKYLVSSSAYYNDSNIQNDFDSLSKRYNLYRTDINGDITFYFNDEIKVVTEK